MCVWWRCHLLPAAVGYFAVNLSGGRVVRVDVAPTGDEFPPDEVLQEQVGVLPQGFGHDCPLMLQN